MLKKSLIFTLLLVFVFTFSFFTAAQEALIELPREETFYVNGLQWGSPSNWNPVSGAPSWPLDADDGRVLLYETLFAFNMLTDELEPLLATDYEWEDELTLAVNLDEKAYFQDEEPVTADDVVYTFEFADRYPTGYSDAWEYLDSVEAVDETTVQFNLNPDNPNTMMVEHFLGFTYILPEHIFSDLEEEKDQDIGEIRSWVNEEPVGSGPYQLRDYTDQIIVLEKYDNYWGVENWGEPVPQYIAHPIYESNEAGNLAFEDGQIDMSQQFIPQVWEMTLNPELETYTWFEETPYYYPMGIPTLIINTQESPMDDPAFRRALAHAIDYERIAQLAMTRYSETANSSMILPEEEPYDQDRVDEHGWEHDPDKAEEILQEAGYTKGHDGMYMTPDGEPIGPLTAECPYGWSDWMVALQIVAENARDVGINVVAEFPEAPVWEERMQYGDFDFALEQPFGGASPAKPWIEFRNSIFSEGVPERGEMTLRNWGRYRNEEVDELIAEIPVTRDREKQLELYAELDIKFMEEAPAIPLMYRPDVFHTWTERYWTNFPTQDNPYAPPQIATDGAAIRTLFNIEPAN